MLKEHWHIMRAKGFCWLAHHYSFMIGYARNGRIGSLHPIMSWCALIPKDQWGVPTDSKDYKVITSKFDGEQRDHRQEIVFIDMKDLKVDVVTKALDGCLMTKKELKKYKFYSDDWSR